MTTFKKITLAALAAALVGTTAMPAFADRDGGMQGWGRDGGKPGWHQSHRGGKHGWHHGRRGNMARMFMERFDTDGDGKVTQAEIDAKVEATFASADANGDGKVTLDEFKVAYQTEFSERRVRAFQRLDRDGDGKISEDEYNRRMERMISRMEQRDGDDDKKGRGGPRGHGRMMERFDADGDGNVTGDEIRAARAGAFASADTDGDKALTLEEFGTIWAERTDSRMVRAFQRLDRDGDLAITREEAARPFAGLVARMDRNGDGALSREDRPRGGMRDRDGKRWHGEGRGDGPRGGGPRGEGPRGEGPRGGNN